MGIGRPYYWASACYGARSSRGALRVLMRVHVAGEEGVVAALEMLKTELMHTMAQAGRTGWDSRSLRSTEPYYGCRSVENRGPWAVAIMSWSDD